MIRQRINRVGYPIAGALDRLAALEQFTSARTDTRRLHIALTRVRRRGMRIETVYDIGAHRGEWTRDIRVSLPDAEFILFEGNEVHARALALDRA